MQILKRVISSILIIAVVLTVVPSYLFSYRQGFSYTPVNAAVSGWQKGASFYPHYSTDFDSDTFRQSLRNFQAAGGNYAVLIVPNYQADDHSSDIYAGGDTPTDGALVSAIQYAHSLGIHVVLKPHLDPSNGDWRANISAYDRDSWYRNYGNMINHLGDLAAQNGVEGIVVGTELISMAAETSNGDNTERWQKIIGDLRGHFSGFLTYGANWGTDGYTGEENHIAFWGSLDYIGISGYFPLAEGQWNPSVDTLTGSWDYWNNSIIKPLHDKYGKPVLFTEIGYRSVDNAHSAPWNSGMGGGANQTEQVNDYQALFNYWNGQDYMSGVYLWNWNTDPNVGGAGDTDYTPQNKQALQTITSAWSGGGTPIIPPPSTPIIPPSTPTDPGTGGTNNSGSTGGSTGNSGSTPSQVSGDFNMTATVPASLVAGQSASIPLTLSNSGSASNVVVDVEIYDSSNRQVAQQFVGNQNISSGQDGHYTITWTPSSNQAYTLKVGVFSGDWTHLYTWNDAVVSLPVGGSSSGGTSNNAGGGSNTGAIVLNVWWPADGSTISGLQPFKAMLENRNASDYTMSWSVDGAGANQMGDSDQDYPHKESLVDVNGWNWNGAGPYNITFTAKDSAGNVIAQKSLSVTVVH